MNDYILLQNAINSFFIIPIFTVRSDFLKAFVKHLELHGAEIVFLHRQNTSHTKMSSINGVEIQGFQSIISSS